MKLSIPEIHYGRSERVVMRVLFAIVVAWTIPESLSAFAITTPNGLARLIDLRFLLLPDVFAVCRYALFAALALYVLHIAWSVVLPYLTLLSIAVGTIINSQGAIGHFMQIVSLVLCAQTAAHFFNLIKNHRTASDTASEDRIIFWSQQAIVATYLVSALTKLIHTSGMWFAQSPLIALQILKTTDQDYYDRLDGTPAGSGVAVAEWMVRHPLPVALVLGAGLILELTAPLALLGRRSALFYGLSLVAFHESVERVMQLSFPFNEYLVWIYLVNVPFWLALLAQSARRRAGRATL